MSEQQPTPGPWTVETIPSDSGGAYITGHITSPLHTYRGNLSDRTRADSITHPDSMTKADAHLIAAAPELLDALKQMTAHMEAQRDIQLGSGYAEEYASIELSKAAIAKAAGR